MNLIERGIHEVADALLETMRVSRMTHRLWVAPCGRVTLAQARNKWKRKREPPGEHLVGTYTATATNKAIRDDLAERLREIQS
jgi:hypothetical protein